MIQSKYKLYVDMDGVLVDWEKQFLRYSGGLAVDVFKSKYGDKSRYELVHKNSPEFYATAPWMSDGKTLYNFLKDLPAEILSHSTDPESSIGKKQWLDKNHILFKPNFVNDRNDKAKFAAPDAILIDDRQDVIDQFNSAGGIGILHTNAADTIVKLKDLLGSQKLAMNELLGVKQKFRIYNSILNPEIWDGDVLKPEILDKLKTIADTFYKDTELSVPIEDITFLGSSAGYNWTPTSDIDLHILIDFDKIDPNRELVKKLVDAYKNRWNEQHNIRIGEHQVEVYIQDVTEKNRSQSVYSILTNQWIKKPSYENIQIDKDAIKTKYKDAVKKIDAVIKSSNLRNMRDVVKWLYNMRESGLSTGGEYSTENIVFKLLRASGYVGRLRFCINATVDKDINKQ